MGMIRSGYLRTNHDRLLFFQVWYNLGSLSIDIDRVGVTAGSSRGSCPIIFLKKSLLLYQIVIV